MKPPDTDEVCVCNVCGKQYLGERRLARHKLSHDTNRVRPYQCDLCDQGFFANCHLVNHIRTHTGEVFLFSITSSLVFVVVVNIS